MTYMQELRALSKEIGDQYKAEVIYLLNHMKSKLLDQTLPLQFKAVSYVNICCTVMERLNQSLPAQVNDRFSDKRLYSILLSQLCDKNPNWWEECWITDSGILQSKNSAIRQILQPITDFIEQLNICQFRKLSRASSMPKRIRRPMPIALATL